ncbi:MAG: efflux RND transporter permease subunit [Bacteroidetes bacterium]|nr:efflux RND transporter permease subunit [Bacteroidota bacterium]
MGITVIFGLAFATVLTLVIVPTFYSTLDDVVNVTRNFVKKHLR